MNISTLTGVVVIALLSGLLFEFKHHVHNDHERLDQLSRDIIRQQEALQVLRAEWSHLNRPDRLTKLAHKHLDLKPIEPHQILSWTTFSTLFPSVLKPSSRSSLKSSESSESSQSPQSSELSFENQPPSQRQNNISALTTAAGAAGAQP